MTTVLFFTLIIIASFWRLKIADLENHTRLLLSKKAFLQFALWHLASINNPICCTIYINHIYDSPYETYLRCWYTCLSTRPVFDECELAVARFMTCTMYPTALNFEYADGRIMYNRTFKCGRVKYSGNATHNTTNIK